MCSPLHPRKVQILPGRIGTEHIEAQDVCPELLHDLLRLDDVAYALDIFLPWSIQGEPCMRTLL